MRNVRARGAVSFLSHALCFLRARVCRQGASETRERVIQVQVFSHSRAVPFHGSLQTNQVLLDPQLIGGPFPNCSSGGWACAGLSQIMTTYEAHKLASHVPAVGADSQAFVGGREVVPLDGLERSLPPQILFQFLSCVMVGQPTVRNLVHLYGDRPWKLARNQASRKSGHFSTVQVIRSLVVALDGVPAKKAALAWAEEVALTADDKPEAQRLLRKWKLKLQRLETVDTVRKRKERSKRGPTKKERRKMARAQVKVGAELERQLLADMEAAVAASFEPVVERGHDPYADDEFEDDTEDGEAGGWE